MEFYINYALIKVQRLIQESLVCFVTNMEYGTSYQFRIYRRLNGETEREILIQETMAEAKYLSLLNYRSTPLESVSLSLAYL